MPPLDFFNPLSNITPFTYRDGETYLEQLKRLRNWTNELETILTTQIEGIIGTFDAGMAQALTTSAQAVTIANGAVATANAAELLAESMVTAQDEAVEGFIIGDTATSKALTDRFVTTFTPERYGAIGDGIVDDTVAVQAALTAAGNADVRAQVTLSNSYRITWNLYAFGNVDIVGSGELIIDANMIAADGEQYWLNMGIKSKRGINSMWTGRLSTNIRATANARFERCINLHYARDFYITQCKFDFIEMGISDGIGLYPGGAISAYNNNAWCIDGERNRGWITENTLLANQHADYGSEGIGIGPATHIYVENNYVHGFGDDPIAMHAVDYFTVTNNRCFTRDGRIIIRSSRFGVVSGNHVERIANDDGTFKSGGGLLEFDLYDAGEWHANTSVRVSDNYLRLPPGVTGPTYMLRAKGLRDSAIINNELCCDSPNTVVSALTVESQLLEGWIDPTGVDVGGLAQVRNLRVNGNYVTGTNPRRISENGAGIDYVSYSNNLASEYIIQNTNSSFSPDNRVIGGNPDGFSLVKGSCIPTASLLFEGDITAAVGVLNKAKRNGVDRWYPRRKCIITSIEVETAAPLTNGYFVIQVRKNGGAANAAEDVPVDSAVPRGRRTAFSGGVNNRATVATDYFEFVTEGVDLAPDPIQCRVRVFGIYSDIG